ncbi:unnamed protein product [Adineta steineri]|uniref:G-protein coupled receptors family 1 profile domain-containing protein n=1 Tax=Adineta steineri TaxID=433720 RepID=A0A815T4D0_9BILA|nr:unnamed protein product [Adineta steineri]CAF4047446.1 unnamed protein product [Adineta steineri]
MMQSHNTHVSILYHKIHTFTLQTQLLNTSCYILFILGIIGNTLGLFIFCSSRRSWQISSTYTFFASSSSIINVFCMLRYTIVLHSTSRNILHDLVGHKWWACKLYEFSFSFRVISSWITLFWMFERLTCVSKKLRLLSERCEPYKIKFIVPVAMMIIILSCVILPPVYMYQPQITSNDILNSTLNMMYCDLHGNVSIKWQLYFHKIHLGMNHFTIRCVFSELFPTGAIIFFNTYIVYCLVSKHRRLHARSIYKLRKKQSRTTSWMNIVLILHSSLFLASLLLHITGHFTIIEAHESWWVLLSILINCSLNFYVYCLSGTAFRNELRRLVQKCKILLISTLQSCQNRQEQSSDGPRSTYEMNNMRLFAPSRTRPCII